jgi:diacylglycerol kinase family enzyme
MQVRRSLLRSELYCGTGLYLRIACIINKNAGSAGQTHNGHIRALFKNYGVIAKIFELQPNNDLTALVERALKEGYRNIVAGGGDGTLNGVVSALIGKQNVHFGILPLGTLNHFARDLDIPMDLEKAVKIIANKYTSLIDVGEVNGRIFLNNSSIGLYPHIVKLRESLQKKGYGKWPAAVWAALRVLYRFRRYQLTLQPASGLKVNRSTAILFVGNNAYDTSLGKLGMRPELNQGRLWITMPNSTSRWSLVKSAIAMIVGREMNEEIYKLEATDLLAKSHRKTLQVSLDGEAIQLQSPLRYRSLGKALCVIVPRPAKYTKNNV